MYCPMCKRTQAGEREHIEKYGICSACCCACKQELDKPKPATNAGTAGLLDKQDAIK